MKTLAQSRFDNSPCWAISLFLDVLAKTARYRRSNDPDRLAKCSSYLLKFFQQRFSKVREPLACPGCLQMFHDPTVRAAIHHIADMPTGQKQAFSRAAKEYETWLRTTYMETLADKMAFDAPLRSVRAYKYL